ncbi:hypothetical protein HPP92_028005, partial [Vanilla planifolia]
QRAVALKYLCVHHDPTSMDDDVAQEVDLLIGVMGPTDNGPSPRTTREHAFTLTGFFGQSQTDSR